MFPSAYFLDSFQVPVTDDFRMTLTLLIGEQGFSEEHWRVEEGRPGNHPVGNDGSPRPYPSNVYIGLVLVFVRYT